MTLTFLYSLNYIVASEKHGILKYVRVLMEDCIKGNEPIKYECPLNIGTFSTGHLNCLFAITKRMLNSGNIITSKSQGFFH